VQQLYKAEPGLHGTKQRQHGRAGRDTVVLVPVGTVVHRAAQPGSAAAAGAATFSGRAQQQQQQEGMHGQGPAAVEQEEEEELPEWIRRWQRPFTGADYSSDSSGEDEESHAAAGSSGGRASGAAGAVPTAGAPPGRAAASSQGRDQQQQQQQQQDEQQQYEVLADLVEDGQEVVVAQGGPAGRGNAAIKARAHRPAPGESEVGSC
jgi:GTPase involved in cell partitioning and DNA repair